MSELTKLPYPVPFPEDPPEGTAPVPFFPVPPLMPDDGLPSPPPRAPWLGTSAHTTPMPTPPGAAPVPPRRARCGKGEILVSSRIYRGAEAGKPIYETVSFCTKGGTTG